ncbi:hypothetical protein V6N11_060181 [Hibiscus sabdariffa]|uniref:Large ribosomal subunit protein bL12 C-terminal domain-containing protein n=1 Tax=Hibiscus sabdariffa TaxID=183260 RepID=A0ABR2P3I1_9ROSI
MASSTLSSLPLKPAPLSTTWLQEKLDVSAAAFAPAAAPAVAPSAGDARATAVEEKTKFNVVIEEVPSNARIGVIKVVRGLTSLALTSLPKKFKGVSKEEADDAKKQLEEAGVKTRSSFVLNPQSSKEKEKPFLFFIFQL